MQNYLKAHPHPMLKGGKRGKSQDRLVLAQARREGTLFPHSFYFFSN